MASGIKQGDKVKYKQHECKVLHLLLNYVIIEYLQDGKPIKEKVSYQQLKQMKILIIDIETTGFLNNGGKIVEVGMVELDLTNGQKRIVYDQVCYEKGITRQECENSWIVKNSDLTVEQIRNSKNLEVQRQSIQSIINAYPLGCTAFNNVFDFGFMENRGFTFPVKLGCPMKISTNICQIPSPRGGYKWPNVQEAYEFFFGKTDYIEKHRGADDAFHEADIVFELYKRGEFKLN